MTLSPDPARRARRHADARATNEPAEDTTAEPPPGTHTVIATSDSTGWRVRYLQHAAVITSADTPAPGRRSRAWPGPCPCACNSGGFCGGCGHAGCGGRR